MKNSCPRQFWREFILTALLGAVVVFGMLMLAPEAMAQTPANDNFANAIEITGTNAAVAGSNVGATMEPGEPDNGGEDGKSVWWHWQAPASVGFVTISTDGSESTLYPGSTLDADLEIYTGDSVSNLNLIATGHEDAQSGLVVRFIVDPGVIYRIAVDGFNYIYDEADYPQYTDEGSIVLSVNFSAGIPPTPTNDSFANAIEITGTNATVTGSNAGATMEAGEPDNYGEDGKSVWWYWKAPASVGFVTFSTDGSDSTLYPGYTLDADLEIYTGNSVSNLNLIATGNEDQASGLSVSFKPVPGVVYRIAVDGINFDYDDADYPEDTDEGSIALSVNFSPGLPKAPGWSLPDITGEQLSSTNFAGQVIVLNFWATWCGPCCDELPSLIALQQKYSADGLAVVGLSVDNATNNAVPLALVSSTVAQYGINYDVAMTRPGGSEVEYEYGGIAYIPSTFIIDRQNLIEQSFVGEQSYSTYEQAILPLLYGNLKVSLSLDSGNIHASWPMTQASFAIQSTGDLTSGKWSVVSTPVQSDGVNNFVDIPVGQPNQFYRLHLQ